MSFSSRLSIVAGGFLLGLVLPVERPVAFGSEPDSQSLSDSESPLLQRVVNNWRVVHSQIKSFYFCWDSQWTRKNSTAPFSKTRTEFWMDDLRYRTIEWRARRQRAADSKPTSTEHETFEKSSEVAFDGPTTYQLSEFGASRIVTGEELHPWQRAERFPVLLAYRALAWWPRSRVLSQNAIIGKTHCVKLERRSGSTVETLWLDPARNDLIVAWANRSDPANDTFLTIEYDHDAKVGWVPARWTSTSPKGPTISSTVTRFRINENIPADALTLKFPPGTTVLDWKGLERYVVAADGSKTDLLRFDSEDAFKVYLALEQTTEYTIDEQPLKDALSFIGQRYLIKVDFDAEAVRQRLVDPTIDVKLSVAGIKMKNALKLLLDQSKKPLTYEVRQGVLTVIPAKI